MSISWVLRSVLREISCTGLSYDPHGRAAPTRRARRLRADADRFHRGARRGVLPPFRRAQGDVDLAPIYERHDPDELDTALASARRSTATAAAASCGGSRARATSATSLARRRSGRRARGEADGDGRRRGDPLPDAQAAADERGGPRPARADRGRAERAHRGAPQRAPLQAAQVVQRETERLGADNYTELYRRFGYPLDDLAGQCRACSPRRRSSGRTRATASSARASASGSARSSAGTSGAPGAARRGTRRSRPIGCCRRWRGRSPTSASTSARQENVELDLEERPNKDPARVLPPIEVPGPRHPRDQAAGRAGRLARALPRGRAHRALRAHRRSLSPEERRLGDNAVTEGWAMLLEHLTIEPVWLERRLDFPRPHEFAAEGATQLLWLVRRYCAKLLYEIEFHAAADLPRCGRATSSCSPTQRRSSPATPTISPTSTTASTRRSTSARGRSRRSCARTCARGSATPGSRAARRARCSASCGRRARSRPPTRCSGK